MFALGIVVVAILWLVGVSAPGTTAWVEWLWLLLGLHLLLPAGVSLGTLWARRPPQ